MTRWPLAPLVSLAAALALGATDARAINKCVDKAGKVTYQDGRCPNDAKEDEVKGLPPPGDPGPASANAAGGRPGASGDDDAEDPHMLDLVSVMVGYEGCTKAFPGFAATHAEQYDAWRTGNSKYLARLEHSVRYQEVLAKGRKENAAQPLGSPEFLETYVRFCNVRFIPMLMRNTPR
jgi:hypothetical protein